MNIIKNHKVLSGLFSRRAVLGVLFLLAGTARLHADMIRLKDGTVYQGKFISNSGDETIFQTADGEKRIPSSSIDHVEVGYSGVPLCYATKDTPRTCGAVLHKLGPDRAVIATGAGNTERKEIPADEIVFLEFEKKSDEKALAVLQKGAAVKLKMGDGTVEGRVNETKDGSLELQMKDGTSRQITEADITSGGLTRSPFLDGSWNAMALIPGYPQLQRGENWKGYGIMGGFGLFATVGLVEYLNAEAVDARAQSDFRFKYFYDQTLVKEFQAHQQNQLYMGIAAGFLYAYHLYDYFNWDGPSSAPKAPAPGVSLELDLGRRPIGYAGRTGPETEAVYTAVFRLSF